MPLPAIMGSPRWPLISGFVVAALSGVVLWWGFHQPAGAVVAAVSSVGLGVHDRNWLPSRWLYAVVGATFVAGILLARVAAPAWFLLVAVACAAAPMVLVMRVLYNPNATEDDYPLDDGSVEQSGNGVDGTRLGQR